MQTGVLMYCFDTPHFKYHRVANQSIRLVKRNLSLPVTVITDEATMASWQDIPDVDFKIMEPEKRNTKLNQPWYNVERHMSYEHSPYDTTIVMDVDYFCFSDKLLRLSQSQNEFLVHKSSHDITGMDSMDNDRHSVIDMVWATVLIFKKTARTKAVFDTVKLIKQNYQHFCNLYRVTYKNFRNDFAFGIALNQVFGFGDYDVIPDSIPAVLNNVTCCDIKGDTASLKFGGKVFDITGSDLHFINKEIINE